MEFHIDKRTSNLPDPQRSWAWELVIMEAAKMAPTMSPAITEDDLTIRCRSTSIPGRGNETLESAFFGMKQKFASKPTFSQSISLTFEEFEDQKISKFLYAWNNRIFDTDTSGGEAGGSKALLKRTVAGVGGYSTNLFLNLYHYDKTKLEKSYKLFNAFPTDVSDVGLDYSGSESVKYNVTFSYDFWNLV
jgi:hypothetical protein